MGFKVQKQVEAEGRVLRRSHSMNDLSGPGLQDKASKLVENLKQQNSPVSKQRNDEKTNTDEKPVVGPATAKHARGEQDAKQVKGEVLRR